MVNDMNDCSLRYRSHRPPSCTQNGQRVSPKPLRTRLDARKKKSEKSVPVLNVHPPEENRRSISKKHEQTKDKLLHSFSEINRLKAALEKAEQRAVTAEEELARSQNESSIMRRELQHEKGNNLKLLETLEQKELMLAFLRQRRRCEESRELVNISSEMFNRTNQHAQKGIGGISFQSAESEPEQKRWSRHKKSISFCDFNQMEGRENQSYEQRMKAYIDSIGKFSDEEEDGKRECFKKQKKRIKAPHSARDDKTRRLKR